LSREKIKRPIQDLFHPGLHLHAANLLHLDQNTLDTLALVFVSFRVAHTVAYMANQGVLRTLMFAEGFISMVTIFIMAADWYFQWKTA
jgi:hypothetical protein